LAKEENISRFGVTDNRRYKFTQVTNSDVNLAKVNNQVDRTIGLDGGIDQNRYGIAPINIGRVSATTWLTVENPNNMRAKKDALNKIASWGVLPLFYGPENEDEPVRFCNARCVGIEMPENAQNCTERNQVADVLFSLSDPRWYSREGLFWVGDEWAYIGQDGLQTTGSQHELTFSSSSENITLGTNGTALTPIDLIFWSNAVSLSNITVKYTVAESVIEQFNWSGTLLANEKLIISSSELSVIRHLAAGGTENSYTNYVISKGTGFLKKYPEGGTLNISGTINSGTLEVFYNNAWY
jgi:hypothetical protein